MSAILPLYGRGHGKCLDRRAFDGKNRGHQVNIPVFRETPGHIKKTIVSLGRDLFSAFFRILLACRDVQRLVSTLNSSNSRLTSLE